MTRSELFNDIDLAAGECEGYASIDLFAPIYLPLTKQGFEAMIQRAAGVYGLPVDDVLRAMAVGCIHHIANDCIDTTIDRLARIMYKHYVNQMTWEVDQEIKTRYKEELKKLQQEELKKKQQQEEHVLKLVQGNDKEENSKNS